MKKILALILAALLVFCMFACAKEESVDETNEEEAVINDVSKTTDEGVYTYELNSDGDYEITGFTPETLDPLTLTLPDTTTEGRDIVGIAKDAFKTVLTLKSVTIPATYTYISDYAFYGCENLETVVTADGLTDLGKGVFQNCVKLSAITLAKTVTAIPEDAFYGCKALTSIDLSGDTASVERGAFFGCDELTTVTFSDKISYVSAYAFLNSAKIVYTVENGAKYLGNTANPHLVLVAAEDLNVETCTVNDNTKVIADRAFAYCSYLETVTLGKNVTCINGTCFENDPEYDEFFGGEEAPVVNLTFNEKDGGLYLGNADNAYMVLISVDKPAAVEDFKIADSVKIIADTAFAYCVNLEDISYAGTQAEWDAVIKSANWNHDMTVNVHCAEAAN